MSLPHRNNGFTRMTLDQNFRNRLLFAAIFTLFFLAELSRPLRELRRTPNERAQPTIPRCA